MENRITLVIPGRARAQIIKPAGEPGYFHSLDVEPRFRRRGYGLELMKFALSYAREFLEMDILCHSKACQRNAARVGYRKVGRASERYIACELWLHRGGQQARFPNSRLRLLRTVEYKRINGKTKVLYLSNSLD